jgi:tripartite-type tricarboxylate transporter receptor subunit TctC
MMMVSRRTVLFGASASALLPATAWSQDQNLKIVYPFSAGNAGEAVARLVADRLQRDLRRPVIVENKSGASGRIGARVVKDALADGTVLLFAVSSQMTIQPHLATDVGYDPFADFAPVSQVVAFDQAVAVPANSPIQSFRELIDWYRANPEQAIYGSPGVGTGPHLVALELARALGLHLRHVAYRGTAAALPDLFTGRIPTFFTASAELMEHHASGKIRILATGGARRSPLLPDVPTFRESGADIEVTGWYAMYVPARTPAEAVKRLEKEIVAAVNDPKIRARIQAMGFQPTGTTAEELRQIQRAEFDHWAGVVRTSGLKVSQ